MQGGIANLQCELDLEPAVPAQPIPQRAVDDRHLVDHDAGDAREGEGAAGGAVAPVLDGERDVVPVLREQHLPARQPGQHRARHPHPGARDLVHARTASDHAGRELAEVPAQIRIELTDPLTEDTLVDGGHAAILRADPPRVVTIRE